MSTDKSSAPDSPAPAEEQPAPSPDPVATAPTELPGVAPRTVDAQSMKAFAHPLRMAIYAHLTDVGSATATALGRHLGESSGQTSYHLRQLEKHGFVEEDAGRGSGRERWWKPIGFALPTYDLAQDESNRPAIQAMLQAQLTQRATALAHWLSTESLLEDQEWIEASIDTTSTRTLTAAQTRALTEELMAVIDRHLGDGGAAGQGPDAGPASGDGDSPEGTRRVRLYLSVFPLPAKDDARQ